MRGQKSHLGARRSASSSGSPPGLYGKQRGGGRGRSGTPTPRGGRRGWGGGVVRDPPLRLREIGVGGGVVEFGHPPIQAGSTRSATRSRARGHPGCVGLACTPEVTTPDKVTPVRLQDGFFLARGDLLLFGTYISRIYFCHFFPWVYDYLAFCWDQAGVVLPSSTCTCSGYVSLLEREGVYATQILITSFKIYKTVCPCICMCYHIILIHK